MNPEEAQKLEHLVHRTLREAAPRRAPATLEGRVLAEIERRAALPWWRKSYVHWPVAMRASFLLVLAVVVKAVLMAVVFVESGLDSGEFTRVLAPQFAQLDRIRGFVAGVADFGATVFHAIPPVWVYGSLALFAACYVTLLGVGAAAYRAFSVRH